MTYADVLQKLDGRQSRKVANNTYLIVRECPDAEIHQTLQRSATPCGTCGSTQVIKPIVGLRLHNTYILTWYANGLVTLDSGGWKTSVTKARLNAWLPNNYRVWSSKHEWFLYRYAANSGAIEHKAEFSNGMTLKVEVQ